MYIVGFILIILLAIFGYKFLSSRYSGYGIEVQNKQEGLRKAEDFTVLNSNGEKVKLSDFFGKPIVVNFWATWCGPCQFELPEFDEAYKKYNEDIEFLMVNLTDGYSETVDAVKAFAKKSNYDFPLYFDTEYSATEAYNIYSIPQTLFIDKEGNILESYTGMMNKGLLESYIEKIK